MLATQTLLNRVLKLKRFVIEDVVFDVWNGEEALFVDIRPRRNSHARCSCCQEPAPVHDSLSTRLFQFLYLFHWAVILRYTMRRVRCPDCGVKVEAVEWSEGKSWTTYAFRLFLARWAKVLPVKIVAETYGIHWRTVYESVRWVVDWGLSHRVLGRIEAVGIDELQIAAGHTYMTVVYQIDLGRRRLLAIAQDRTSKSLRTCLDSLGAEACRKTLVVCSDMWRPYLDTIRTKLPNAMNVLDRFHVVAKFNKIIDEIRAAEARELVRKGCRALAHTRYCFLKRVENLTEKQRLRLDSVLCLPLVTVKAYLLKESFQAFWEFAAPRDAQWFLRKWCQRANRSKIPKVKKFVETLKRHEPLIMNWFRARKEFSNGITEGMNRKVGLTDRMACGFRSFEVRKTMLFHQHGLLPEPPVYSGLAPRPN